MVVKMHGSNAEQYGSTNSPCMPVSSTKTFLYPPFNYNFEHAFEICRRLGGSMPLPATVDDTKALVEIANNTSNTDCKYAWLPIVQSGKADKEGNYDWVHHQSGNGANEKVAYLPWGLGQPNGLDRQRCVIVIFRTEPYYDDSQCSRRERCWHCSFNDSPSLAILSFVVLLIEGVWARSSLPK